MSESYKKAIKDLIEELDRAVTHVTEIKKTINQLCKLGGDPPYFDDIETENIRSIKNLKPDQFFGKGVSTAAKEYLLMKGSAATLDEIYDALIKGGFEFTGDKKLWRRGLSISLGKNSRTFVYIKNNESFGLVEFYPDYKQKEAKNEKEEAVEDKNMQEPIKQ